MAAGQTGQVMAKTDQRATGTAQANISNAPAKPSEAQLRYLCHGLEQPGGKLPLFDADGREISAKTIQACIDRGWAAPWFDNPIKRGWLVCRLTQAGRAAASGG
jgi:hypothetical protein